MTASELSTTCKRCISALLAGLVSAFLFVLLDQYILSPDSDTSTRYCDSSLGRSQIQTTGLSCVPCPTHAICENASVSSCIGKYTLDERGSHKQCVRDSSLLSRVEKLSRCAELVRQRFAINRVCEQHSALFRWLSSEKVRRDAQATRLSVMEMKDQMQYFCPSTTSGPGFHEDYKHWILDASNDDERDFRKTNDDGFVEFLLEDYELSRPMALQFLEERSEQGLEVSPTCKLELRASVQLRWSRIFIALVVARAVQCLQRQAWRRGAARQTLRKIVAALKSSRKRQLNEFDVKAMLKVNHPRERDRIWRLVEELAMKERRIRVFPEYIFGEVHILWEFV